MKNTEILKKNAKKLEAKIDILFNEFYEENGKCDIYVTSENVLDAMDCLIGSRAKVEVTV